MFLGAARVGMDRHDNLALAHVAVVAVQADGRVLAAGPARRFVISAEGGSQPVWRRDGSALYFVDPRGQLQSVAVRWSANGEPSFGLPARLEVPRIGSGHRETQYDISPDGSRLYFMAPTEELAPREMQVAINWGKLLD